MIALAEVALRAEELLRSWLVVLPRVAVFERLMQSLCRRAERQVFTRIEEQLPKSFLGEIDSLLDVPESERRFSLFPLLNGCFRFDMATTPCSTSTSRRLLIQWITSA